MGATQHVKTGPTMAHCEKTKPNSGRRWSRLATIMLGLLAFTCMAEGAQSADMAGAIRIPEGGYLYASDAKDLTDARHGGLTVEAWVRLADTPTNNNLWPLVVKGESYYLFLTGGRAGGLDALLPGEMKLYVGYGQPPADGRVAGNSFAGFPLGPRFRFGWGVDTWVHVAYQIVDTGRVTEEELFLNGRSVTAGLQGGPWVHAFGLGGEGSPLYIAGLPPAAQHGLSWQRTIGGYDYRSMAGWIDEVRISRGSRYDGQNKPIRGDGPDVDTVALWTFDAPISQRGTPGMWFPDVTGHGHTLLAGGALLDALAVTARDRSAGTWAQLKRQ